MARGSNRRNGTSTPTSVLEAVAGQRKGLVDALTEQLNNAVNSLDTTNSELTALQSARQAAGRRVREAEQALSQIGESVTPHSLPDDVEVPVVRRAGRGIGRGAPGRKRPQNDSTLPEALARVLRNKTMSVIDASAAVQKAGYNTSSQNFRVQVNQALLKNTNLFKKVSRGQYTAK